YAVLGEDKSLYVTLINKELKNTPEANVTLELGDDYNTGRWVWLRAPDLAATSSVTLAGSQISHGVSWSGRGPDPPAKPSKDRILLKLPAASAAVIRFDK